MKRHDLQVIGFLAAALAACAGLARADGADPLPPGQVWECKTDGQHVFSDKRCGTGASIRQLSAVNTMDAPAPMPRAPRYPTAEDATSEPAGDAQSYAPEDADEVSSGVAPLVYYGGIAKPRRALHRPRQHISPKAPQAAPAPKVTGSRAGARGPRV